MSYLISGYQTIRVIPEIEQRALFLCNCTFRFLTYAGTANSNAYMDLFLKLKNMIQDGGEIQHRIMNLFEQQE